MECLFCIHPANIGNCCGYTIKNKYRCTRSEFHLGPHIACGRPNHFLSIERTETEEFLFFTIDEKLPILFSST